MEKIGHYQQPGGDSMEIRILELIEGAKKAEGLTVIIDVFRAFSLECYLYARGASAVFPAGAWRRPGV